MNKISNKIIDFNLIREPVLEDIKRVNSFMNGVLGSRVPLAREIVRYIIESGGKRLRPLLLLLTAKLCQFHNKDYKIYPEKYELSVIIELIHTATLLHDDVIDASKMRRGIETVNSIWGNKPSILVGDFLYSRAFQILTNRNNPVIMTCLSSVTNTIAEGEVEQLMNQGKPDISAEDYYRVIYYKTARLFEISAEMGAISTNSDSNIRTKMARYGYGIGMAFQIVDDLLDYCSNKEKMEKNMGDDLSEGKTTLPLIVAMERGSVSQKKYIKDSILKRNTDNISGVLEILEYTDALRVSMNQARIYANFARKNLDQIANSPAKVSLIHLTKLVVNREF